MSNITSIEASVQKSVTHYALHFSTLTQTQKGHVRCHFLANALEWLATGSKREALQVDPDNTLSFICLNDRSSLCGKVAKWALSFFEPLIRTIFWSFNREFANSLQNQERISFLRERIKASGINAFSVREIVEFTPAEFSSVIPPLMEKGFIYNTFDNKQCKRAAIFLRRCVTRSKVEKEANPFEKNTNAQIKQALNEWITNDQLPQEALAIFSKKVAEIKLKGFEKLIVDSGIQFFTLEEIKNFSATSLRSVLNGLDKRRLQTSNSQYFATSECIEIATLIKKCVGTEAMDLRDQSGESIAIQIINEFHYRIREIERESPQAKQIFDAAFKL